MKTAVNYFGQSIEVMVPALVTALSPSLAVIVTVVVCPALASARQWLSAGKK